MKMLLFTVMSLSITIHQSIAHDDFERKFARANSKEQYGVMSEGSGGKTCKFSAQYNLAKDWFFLSTSIYDRNGFSMEPITIEDEHIIEPGVMRQRVDWERRPFYRETTVVYDPESLKVKSFTIDYHGERSTCQVNEP